jgi:hypothetical protein
MRSYNGKKSVFGLFALLFIIVEIYVAYELPNLRCLSEDSGA